MNERIKLIRQHYNLSLSAFGQKLGVTASSISRLENGERNITEQMFKAICREYNINPHWLQTGEGDMFLETDNVYLAKIDNILTGEDDNFKKLFKVMLDFDNEEIQILNSMIDKIIAMKDQEQK